MKKADFKYFQESFYKHLQASYNPVEVEIRKIIVVSSEGSLDDFVGSNDRSQTTIFTMNALYQRMVSKYDREKYGVSQDVSVVVFISPLELKAEMGDMKFPDYFNNSLSGFTFHFLGKKFKIVRVQAMEEFHDEDGVHCMAYQFDLERDEGY